MKYVIYVNAQITYQLLLLLIYTINVQLSKSQDEY